MFRKVFQAAVCLAFVCGSVPAGPNLLTNGDFELNPMDANGWYFSDSHGNHTTAGASWATDYSYSPSHSAKIVSGDPFFRQSSAKLSPNTHYIVSFWLKTDCSGTYRYSIAASCGWDALCCWEYMGGVSDWRQLEFGFTNGPEANASILVGFGQYHYNTGGSGTGWIDDISVSADDIQPLNRSGWSVSASWNSSDVNLGPTKAIDGNPGSCHRGGNWFVVDMGVAQTFNRIVIEGQNFYKANLPQGFNIYVSDDTASWGNVVATKTATGLTDISFPNQTRRYVKIATVGNAGGDGWSIGELNFYKMPGNSIQAPAPRRVLGEMLAKAKVYSASGRLVKEYCGKNDAWSNRSFTLGLALRSGVYFVNNTDGVLCRRVLQ